MVMAMGMCFTGMGMLSPGSLLVWMRRGEVLEPGGWSRGGAGRWGEVATWRGVEGAGLGPGPKMDCMGAWMSEDWRKPTATLLVASDWLNMLVGERGEEWESEGGDGEAMLVIMGERRGDEVVPLNPRGEEVGEGLRTGEEEPLGEPSLRRMVEEMVFLAACLARSVLTKLDTRSSRFPLRLGEARSSRGTSAGAWEIWVMEEPRWGDSLVEEEGEETADGEEESEEEGAPGTRARSRLW